MVNSSSVRVRFAPSPTGMLHIGGLRTALFNYLFARHMQGKFLLRIEDTDKERSTAEYTQAILDTLSWCGLTSDEPVVIQSQRIAEHLAVAEQLIARGKAYYCYCSMEEVQRRVGSVAHDGVTYARYDGYCKRFIGQKDALHLQGKAAVIRFLVPEHSESVTVDDAIKGKIVFKSDTFDDFILVRSDGMPMYNFVVVVDDAFMRVSHIIRGEEHLINTPKQLLLYQACGYTVPTFAHLPLILGPDGTKMSKRDAAANAYEYKKRGYLPTALCNYLVRLGWAYGDQEIFTMQQMIDAFSLEGVSSKGALFDHQKLDWVNSMHIKELSAPALEQYMQQTMHLPVDTALSGWSAQSRALLIDQYKKRAVTLEALYQELVQLHTRPVVYEGESLSENQRKLLEQVSSALAAADFTGAALHHAIKDFCHTQEIKLNELGPLIRVALTGKKDAPGIYDLLAALGKDEVEARIAAYLRS